jgi:predicted enzyme related to lactoylglutathione lyase
VSLSQFPQKICKEHKNMPNPVVHFEVIGKDKAALEAFYKAAFDWQFQPVMDEYTLIFPGAGPNGGVGTMPSAGSYVTFYVEVPSVAAQLEKIEGLGGKKLMGPMQVPNGPVIGMFNDPEGHMIGICEPFTPPGM